MRNALLAVSLTAAIGISGAAFAQTQADYYPYNVSLRGGAVIPADSRLTDVGNILGNIGLDYKLDRPLFGSGETYFALDWFFRAFGGNGASGSAVPFTINQRFYTSDLTNRSYFFIGVGGTYLSTSGGNGTAITLRGGVGRELSTHTFAEITAYLSDRAAGARANAIAFNFGYRF